MLPFDELGLQAAVCFTSSLAGMAVYMKLYCPNGRCCHTSDVRSLLEYKKRLISLETEKENR